MLKEETQRRYTPKVALQELSSEENILEYFRILF